MSWLPRCAQKWTDAPSSRGNYHLTRAGPLRDRESRRVKEHRLVAGHAMTTVIT
jgi:hypothetical protein